MIRVKILAVGVISAVAAGCSASSSPDNAGSHESIGQEGSALMGNVSYDPAKACSAAEQTFINNATRAGRITATSATLGKCIDTAMRYGLNVSDDARLVNYMGGSTLGPYRKCTENGTSDPTYIDHYDYNTPELSGEIEHAIQDTKSPNALQIGCDPAIAGTLAAQADGVLEQGANPEKFAFQQGNLDGYIASNFVSFTAGTIWHEAMHQHAYHHATGSASACGYPNDPETDAKWMYRHTIPYIVGNCVRYVIDQANASAKCSKLVCDAPNELPILSSPYNTGYETCGCVRDPSAPALPPPPPPPPAPGNNVVGGYAGGQYDSCTTCKPPGTKPKPILFQ